MHILRKSCKNKKQVSAFLKELLEKLEHLRKVAKAAKIRMSVLEITILKNKIVLVIPGVEVKLAAKTTGSAKFSKELWYIHDVVKSSGDEDLEFTVEPELLKLRNIGIEVETAFFVKKHSVRNISLPINHDYQSLVQMQLLNEYTLEEMIFNNVERKVIKILSGVTSDIKKIAELMGNYNFSREQIVTLIKENTGIK